MLNKIIYFHICPIGRYAEIIKRIMSKICDSGLLKDVNEIRYLISGNPEKDIKNNIVRSDGSKQHVVIHKHDVIIANQIMDTYPKTKNLPFKFDVHDTESELYENSTLNRLIRDCIDMTETTYILYVHSKGVTRDLNEFPGVDAWTDAMLDGLSMYREICWKKLEIVDAVGSFVKGNQNSLLPLHFSGNFWWSKSSHLANLSVLTKHSSYMDSEMLIIGSQPLTKYACIANSIVEKEYYNKVNLAQYRASITFYFNINIPEPIILISTIKLIEMGFDEKWTDGRLPGRGRFNLSIIELGIGFDTHPGTVKMVRVTLNSGIVLYYLENEVVIFT